MTIADTDIYLADVGARDPDSGETTLRFSGAGPSGYTTGASDTPASTLYPTRLEQVSMLPRSMFAARTTSGRSQVSTGDVVLGNDDFALDRYKRYAFDGRRIVVRRGQIGAAYPAAWTSVLDATMTTPAWDGPVALKIRDNQKYLDAPLQTTAYAGDNVAPDGLEGTPDDLKGKLKPVCVCGATNVSPPCINAPKQIYQPHDGAISDVPAVRDRGAPLGRGVSWARRTTSFAATDTITGVAKGGGAYVAVGYNTGSTSAAATSPTGATWTARTLTGFTSGTARAYGVEFGNGVFLAFGDGGKLSRSTDNGVTWVLITAAATAMSSQAIRGAVYLTTLARWVIVGGTKAAYSNDDGVTWTGVTVDAAASLFGIAFGLDLLVTSSLAGALYTSADAGATWTKRTTAFSTTNYLGVAFSGTFFAAAGATGASGDGFVAISFDGINWARVAVPGANPYMQMAGGNGQILAVDGVTGLWSSATGTDWTLTTGAFDWHGVAWGAYASIRQVASGEYFVGGKDAAAVGGGDGALLQSTPATYADTTALLDDKLAPQAGTYIVCPSAGMFRLGSSPNAPPTCDVLVGATTADRTAAQAFVIANEHAGNTAGDWSASDITALDAADNSEVEFWAGPDDKDVKCSDLADAAARTVGAGWWADTSGVLRIRQLTAPDPNVVANPDTITAGTGWTAVGTAVGTANYANVGGVPLTRVTGLTSSYFVRPVTLTGNTAKRFSLVVQWDGVAGTTEHGVYDSTAGAYLAFATITWSALGVATVVVPTGSLVRFFSIAGNAPNAYGLIIDTTTATAAHAHVVYPAAGGTSTSIRVGRVTVFDSTTPQAFNQNELDPPLTPVPSNEPNGGISQNKTSLRYAKNHTVQTTDIADIVADADRVFYGLEWREAVDDSMESAVLTRHPLSQPASVETLYRFEADAQAEAMRRQALFGEDREWYECGVKMTTTTVALDLGDVVEIADNRYGIGPASRFRILGIRPELQPDDRNGKIILTLWR